MQRNVCTIILTRHVTKLTLLFPKPIDKFTFCLVIHNLKLDNSPKLQFIGDRKECCHLYLASIIANKEFYRERLKSNKYYISPS